VATSGLPFYFSQKRFYSKLDSCLLKSACETINKKQTLKNATQNTRFGLSGRPHHAGQKSM
jgi:hypothetical protein